MANLRYLEESLNKFRQLEKVIQSGFEITKNFAEDVEEGKENQKLIENLRKVMIHYAEMEQDVKNSSRAAEHAMEKFQQSIAQESDEIVDMETLFTARLDELSSKSKHEDLLKHKAIVGFTETVWKHHFGGANNSSQEDNDGNQQVEDLEIQMTQMDDTQKFICPITKTEVVKPVRNRLCNHTYSRFAIEQHIKNSPKQRAKCPVAGCIHFVDSINLEDDAMLAFELKRKKK